MIQHRIWQQVESTDTFLAFQANCKTFPVPDLLLGGDDPKLSIEPDFKGCALWRLRSTAGTSGTSLNLITFMQSAECNSTDTAVEDSLVKAASCLT